MNFCPYSYMLLELVTSENELKFKSTKTGTIYNAKPENTLIASEESDEIQSVSKYKNILGTTAFDPTSPRVRIPGGCEKCHNKIVSFQRVGIDNKIVYVCTCGAQYVN